MTRIEGLVVASVMSLLGAYRHFLSEVADIDRRLGFAANDEILRTGDTRPAAESGHVCRMFRWSELVEMFSRHPCRLRAASASQWGALGPLDTLERVVADPAWWDRFLDREEAICAEPGAIDEGNHILFAVEKNGGGPDNASSIPTDDHGQPQSAASSLPARRRQPPD